jgi:hypothetical protein
VGGNPITRLSLLAGTIAVVLALGGCGGGSSSDSSSEASTAGESSGKSSQGQGESSPEEATGGESGSAGGGGEISDAAFVKQANAICEEGKKKSIEKMGAYVRKLKEESGGSKKQALSHLREAIQVVIVPGIAEQVEEVRALDVSGADKARVDEFLAAMEEGIESAEEAKGSSTAPFAKSFKRSAQLAHEIGLDGCAYG